MLVRAQQGDTLDALCWRHLGATQDVVEQALERNPGLADFGPVLPHATLVDLPDRPVSAPVVPTVHLWE